MKELVFSSRVILFHSPDHGGGPSGPDPGDVIIDPNGTKINDTNATADSGTNLPDSAYRTLASGAIQVYYTVNNSPRSFAVAEVNVPVKNSSGGNATTLTISGSAGGTPTWQVGTSPLTSGATAGHWPSAYWKLDTSRTGTYKTTGSNTAQDLPSGVTKIYLGFTTA